MFIQGISLPHTGSGSHLFSKDHGISVQDYEADLNGLPLSTRATFSLITHSVLRTRFPFLSV